jgi:three-Cys-motif partner protein
LARKSSQQILKELQADADGLKMRRIGIWTLEKLAIINLYLAGFTNASSGARGGVYIDGLAGPGLCEVRGARAPPKFVWGSPLLAPRTRPTFQKCHMVEFNQSSFAVLKRRVSAYGDRANPMPGNVNEILPSLLRSDVHPRAPCFCLLDPEGTEIKLVDRQVSRDDAWTTANARTTDPFSFR